jgi:hypothetical protein
MSIREAIARARAKQAGSEGGPWDADGNCLCQRCVGIREREQREAKWKQECEARAARHEASMAQIRAIVADAKRKAGMS